MYENTLTEVYKPPNPGDEIVISGISGRYPESRNILEFKDNLMNKVNVITSNYDRWKIDHPEIPREGGKIGDMSKFDAVFFGVHFKQAHTLDPMCRMLMEHSYEAIVDAGINPKELRGSNTGVVIGACISESEKVWFYEKMQANGFGITGCSRAMFANRVSYFLDLHGPSYTLDTACSSSMVALDQAFRLIQSGQCDNVLVGGANLCLHPYVTLQFARLGVLSSDCRCKSFDAKANGYVRSEAICVILLQKARAAKRIYSTVCYTRENCDGYKEQGITFPASEIQRRLLEDFYQDCGIPKTCLSYLEAHGTGTAVGDPEELIAINKVFCEGRTTPLRIGSVKSNIGHSEPASGLCSITKVIIGMECGLIPPNMNFESPLKGVECFDKGRVQVITEPTPWEGGYVGVNSFGFGGSNAHVLLKSNPKDKINNGAPNDDLPRLVVISGRTNEAVETLLNAVESGPGKVDVEYVRLLHDVFTENTPGHIYRGYTLVGNKTSENPIREIQNYSGKKRPIWFIFSGMGSQWPGMGEALMRFPVFAKAIEKCDAVLKPRGVDIIDIITNKDKKTFDNILNSFVGIAAVQIGLVDLLTSLDIVPDNIIGHSVGELGCAYADGCFTAEQMVLSAYSRGLASIETEMIRGSMAAVGLGYDDIKDSCPPDIEVACHNGPDSCTISGPADSMKEFVAKLQSNKIFAKEVPCSNIAYHSRYIAAAGSKLLEYLKQVIPNPKARSRKWLSTSVPRKEWSTPAALLSSAEYHTNNLLKSVLFAETAMLIPKDAVTIEIAPHGLLQAILKRSLDPAVINVSLTQRGNKDNVEYCLHALGKLYNIGLQPKLANIYPAVQFPVSRGTPMISPYIRWEHQEDWFSPIFSRQKKMATGERALEVGSSNDNYDYMVHHVIDGRNLIPATGYLLMVWETLCLMMTKERNEVSVVFENVKFERATNFPSATAVTLIVMVQKGTGRFEVVEGTTAVVTGTIRATTNPAQERIPNDLLNEFDVEEPLKARDIYKELKLRGYDYTGIFRGLTSASIDGVKGHIMWQKNWVTFTDNMLQFKLLGSDTRGLYVPTSILKMVIDSKLHFEIMQNLPDDKKEFPVYMYKKWDVIRSGGVEVRGLNASAISRRKNMATPVLEEYKFVANRDRAEISLRDMITFTTHLALENRATVNPKILELITDDDDITSDQLLIPTFIEVLSELPMVQTNVTLAANPTRYETSLLPSNTTRVEPEKMPNNGAIFIAVGYDLFTKKKRDFLEQLLLATTDDGYLLTRETTVNEDTFLHIQQCGFNVILEKSCGNQIYLLLKKQEKLSSRVEVVYVNNYQYDWLEKIQKLLKEEAEQLSEPMRLIVVAEGDIESGALGFVKCLRKELNGEIVKTVVVQDENAPKFSLENPLYAKQIELDIAINILRPGNVWGTYRHLPLPPVQQTKVQHGFLEQTIRGDLNALQWLKGSLEFDPKNENLVHIEYSSLNFRDVMVVSGKLPVEALSKNRFFQTPLIGFEYSGVTVTGRRVMGFLPRRGISNMCEGTVLQWEVPDEWTLEDAATVPSSYATAYIALFKAAYMKKGDKVLIHAGSGALGQAAINFALYEGCEVFTTVGTPAKRKFIRETFPSIDDNHIGNSRDTSFEQLVLTQTDGKGVDIVLNSLAEEKLLASVRCLANGGRFLEVGKFDMTANNPLGMGVFIKEVSFHGILLDSLFYKTRDEVIDIYNEISRAFKSKAVKPLVRTCFAKNEIQTAFRYMAAGKHIGKVLIKIREDNEPLGAPVIASPRFNASPDKSYVLFGGLGGLGLEIADWLILRGARNLVLISRTGIKNGYQRMRTELWKSYGVNVLIISGVDASKTDDCEFILKSAGKQAPVDGIFNLAALLRDNSCINQTPKAFDESLRPKMLITKKLDEVSRKVCPRLRHFVVFSSISCGRGNAGQTNYGMGNSVMERICERRVEEGLPGLAIQWGAVGDVGLAAEMLQDNKEVVIGGTLPQRMSSCLEVLDTFLTQDRPIVGSMVVAEKRTTGRGANSVLETVMNIMGLKDLKGISPSSTLPDIGMDSMMAVEIKQSLEREYEVFLTSQDIRNMDITGLIEMSTEVSKKDDTRVTKSKMKQEQQVGIKFLMRNLYADILHSEVVVELPTHSKEKSAPAFLIPGIEGSSSIFTTVASKMKCPAICLQLPVNSVTLSILDMVNCILPYFLEENKDRRNPVIVGYSFGSLVAIELVRKLEDLGFNCRLVLIDGTPDYMNAIKNSLIPSSTEDEFQNKLLIDMMSMVLPIVPSEFLIDLNKYSTWEQKMDVFLSYIPPNHSEGFSVSERKLIPTVIYNRLLSIGAYDYSDLPRLKANVALLKPISLAIRYTPLDYGLSKMTEGKVDVHDIEGNHITMLESDKVGAAINGEPLDDEETFKASITEVDSLGAVIEEVTAATTGVA